MSVAVATVEFNDPPESNEALTPNVSTVKYTLTGLICPGVADLQAALTAPGVAPVAGDLVVRGAVPCLVSVDVGLTSLTGVPQGDIAIACSDYVQNLGFDGRVYASRLQFVVQLERRIVEARHRRVHSGISHAPNCSRAKRNVVKRHV